MVDAAVPSLFGSTSRTDGQCCPRRLGEASRRSAERRLLDELLRLFGGRSQPVMAHLIETGKLTLDDVHEAEKALRRLSKKESAE